MSRSKSMRRSRLARALAALYPRLPAQRRVLALIANLEGGQYFSASLRDVLRVHHGVEVGPYTYGSLLEPGMADRGTVIGPYVSIGPNVRRIGASHPVDALSMHPFWFNETLGFVDSSSDVPRGGCSIGPDVWIGANATILPGCRRIGIGAVIGAGSIVTSDIPDFAIAVGVPARVVRFRLEPAQQSALSLIDWNLPPLQLREQLRDVQ